MKISSLTDIGTTREMNQDYLYSSEEAVGNLPNLFLVADGMGGHKAGEFASRFAVEAVVAAIRENQEKRPVAILSQSIQRANRRLKEYADEHQQMKGGNGPLCCRDRSRYADCGKRGRQSPVYHRRYDRTDHGRPSLVQEMVRLGKMDEESARNHPNKNIITRAIGTSEDVKIDIFERQVHAGEYIVLCSDGLTNMVEDSVILEVLHGTGSLADKTERLVELANQNGGRDNITVTIIEPNSDEVTEC